MTKNKDLYHSIARSMIGRYAVYAVNLLSMMVLARMFTPETFGTVAAILVFFVFFQQFAEAGLGPAIINLSALTNEDRDGLFSLTLGVGLASGLLFYSAAPLFLALYEFPRVDEVVPHLAVSTFFFSASIVPNALLLRQQAFYKIAKGGLAAEVLSTAATISLATVIDPLHALAAKGPCSAATLFFISWYLSSDTEFGRPLPGQKISAVRPLFEFARYQFGFNLINYFSRNLDNILVGKYMGANMLGIYDKAYQLMRYPLLMLTFAMTPAIQPVIRRHADDHAKVEEIHRDFTFRLSLLGTAAGLAMYLLAEWIILLALGNQWMDVVPIIKILAIAIPVQVVLATSGSFFQGMNRADVLFSCGTINAVVMVTAMVLGIVSRDIEILCWCLVGAFHINFVQIYYYMYRKLFRKPLRRHLFRMIPAFVVILGMVMHASKDLIS
jgi:O-antigen/teichoic acid export membrane protein